MFASHEADRQEGGGGGGGEVNGEQVKWIPLCSFCTDKQLPLSCVWGFHADTFTPKRKQMKEEVEEEEERDK